MVPFLYKVIPMRTIVLADTNALMAPFQMGFNLEIELRELLGPYQIFVIDGVWRELNSLAKTNRYARMALVYAQSLPEPESSEVLEDIEKVSKEMGARPADDAFIELARMFGTRSDIAFFTNDRYLRDRLNYEGARVIIVRSRSHLVFYRE